MVAVCGTNLDGGSWMVGVYNVLVHRQSNSRVLVVKT